MLPIYIMNLDSQPERWKRVTDQLIGLSLEYTRVPAVRQWEYTPEEIAQYYDIEANRRKYEFDLTDREVGNYLTHLQIWRQVAGSTNLPGAFIFEDDFTVKDGFVQALESLSNVKFKKPSIVKLDNRTPTWALYEEPLNETHTLITPHDIGSGASAYYINRQAARRLIKIRRRFYRPVDDDFVFYWETRVDIKTVAPAPCTHPPFEQRGGESLYHARAPVRNQALATPEGSARAMNYRLKSRRINKLHAPWRKLWRNTIVR